MGPRGGVTPAPGGRVVRRASARLKLLFLQLEEEHLKEKDLHPPMFVVCSPSAISFVPFLITACSHVYINLLKIVSRYLNFLFHNYKIGYREDNL